MWEFFYSILSQINDSRILNPFMAVAIVILGGYLGGYLVKFIKLPHVTGNILGGVLIGPWGLKILSEHDIHSLA